MPPVDVASPDKQMSGLGSSRNSPRMVLCHFWRVNVVLSCPDHGLPSSSYRRYSRFIPIRCYDVPYSNSGDSRRSIALFTMVVSVIEAALKCLNDGEPLTKFSKTLVCLILKVQSAEQITDYHPISLFNVMYKIIVKSLANRLQTILGEVITESRSVFILGRLITSNTIIGFQCLHAIRTLKWVNGSLALKLDMSKAYDRVEWNLLAKVMILFVFLRDGSLRLYGLLFAETFKRIETKFDSLVSRLDT
ncbi:hypothetical protein Dsin_028953 [Dipteronia sinensis]|uniref:Reverse transcriptase domain-containing protein n=1 Tax=Dipteronia sinensis TaxID=43782 RepID=A0AAD9ZRR3_9ROSI|nr:hypothetical protein Dsin_028953 [Dipteronia sinensis]